MRGKAHPTGDFLRDPSVLGGGDRSLTHPQPSSWDEKLAWGTEPALGMGCSWPNPQKLWGWWKLLVSSVGQFYRVSLFNCSETFLDAVWSVTIKVDSFSVNDRVFCAMFRPPALNAVADH